MTLMRLTTRPCLAWIAGVAWVMHTAVLWSLEVYQSLIVLALFLFVVSALYFESFSRAYPFKIGPILLDIRQLLALFGLFCLAGASTGWRAHLHRADVLAAPWEGVTLVLQGRIDDLPHASPQGWRLTLAVTEAHVAPSPASPKPRSRTLAAPTDVPLQVPPRVALHWPMLPESSGPAPRAGEVWRLSVRLRQPHGLHNPGGSDPELWWWSQGIGATGSIRINRDDPAPERLQAASPWQVVVWRERVRTAIENKLTDPRIAGVLTGLVVGDQQAIHSSDWGVFRATGVAHLMSISGLHITLWAWLATRLVGRLWRLAPHCAPVLGSRLLLAVPVPVAAAWGGLCLALLYAVFSGWGVPAQRTIWMLALVVMLRLHGRYWPWPTVAAAAMVVVLCWEPWAWMQPGFWLSFVAVMVLIMTDQSSALAPAIPSPHTHPVVRGLLNLGRAVWRLVREQTWITVALAPLTLLCFGQVSVVGWFANLLAVPWVTLLVTPLGLAGLLWSECWVWAAWALVQLQAVLTEAASWSWATWSAPQAPWPYALLGVIGGIVLVLKVLSYWRLMGLILMLPILYYPVPKPAEGEFEVIAADVGQGSAVLIRTASTSVLYDAGPMWSPDSEAGQRVLLPLLRSLGAQPSRFILSHSDADHVGGASSVLGAFSASYKSDRAQIDASFKPDQLPIPLPASALHLPWRRCEAGQRWVQDGVQFDVLHPAPDLYQRQPPLSTNDASCVLWVRGRSASVLLTGDLSARFESTLTAAHPDLRATVLMAPHHGSKTSSSLAFLQAVQPEWVFIQAGYRNRYNHPAPEVMARYQALGLRTRATADCGAIRWQSTDRMPTCYRDQAHHHWHWQAPVLQENVHP